MLALSVESWLGVATVLVSFAGLAMTVFSYITGRKDATKRAEEICHDKLLEAHRKSEDLSAELYKLRMEKSE